MGSDRKARKVNVMTDFTEPLSRHSRALLECMAEELLFGLVTRLQAASEQAAVSHSDLSFGAGRDLYPHTRHALVQHSWLELGKTYGHGVVACERRNSSNNRSHVEISAGSVVLIPAAVDRESDLPREAAYRRSLAENPQAALPGLGLKPTPAGNALLAVMLYGPSCAYPGRQSDSGPAFAVIRFPLADWSGYAVGRVDVLGRLLANEKGQRYRLGPQLRRQRDIA